VGLWKQPSPSHITWTALLATRFRQTTPHHTTPHTNQPTNQRTHEPSSGVIGLGVGGGQALSAVASGFMKADAVVAICPVGHDAKRVAGAMRTPTLLVAAGEGSVEVSE
jgi:hypothetical protein